ncbi:MAG TPA: benzoate-CoA ligase family protein [Gemmatimonadota bacterium]|nr:benzoate-CoA ligase family protein [Gemmatimonadota bacterium]
MPFEPPEQFNMADWFLDARLREGRGGRVALRTAERNWTYEEITALAARYASVLADAGIEPEQRVILALDDGPGFVGALFGVLKIGAVVVMVNPRLPADAIAYFVEYTRAKAAIAEPDAVDGFRRAGAGAPCFRSLLVAGEELDAALAAAPAERASFPTHRDDSAIWLFSGGTTGRPKAVLQTHASYANTTECYGKGVLGVAEDDMTMSVPRLFFGYATGSNLLFPFSVGASCVLFREHPTAEVVFEMIARHRPTILVNVPKMVALMVDHPRAAEQDLSSLRLATSAGEALPVELHRRWDAAFGVDLLDGLGTAEMWHIFLSNRPGDVHPGTLGKVVPGFEVEVRDDEGRPLPDGEVGWLWVKGGSRAIAYWHRMRRTMEAFRGEWYVSGDMVSRDAAGVFTYAGRADDMLKVSGKWLAPGEVESCLLEHPDVAEAAVVGVFGEAGLTVPRACVVRRDGAGPVSEALAEELRSWVRERLEPYKYPREVVFLDALPRTHLGKIDRASLRELT